MDEWTPKDAKVVGIETKVYTEKRVAQASRWFAAAIVLGKHFPELRNEIADYLPPEFHDQLTPE